MDRRAFLETMAAAVTLNPLSVLGSHQDLLPVYLPKDTSPPSRVRLISLGAGSLDLLSSFLSINGSPIVGWSLPPEDILYITHKGELKQNPMSQEGFDFQSEHTYWQKCQYETQHLYVSKMLEFKGAEKGISNFIQGADWLFIAVALDNAMAFEACVSRKSPS